MIRHWYEKCMWHIFQHLFHFSPLCIYEWHCTLDCSCFSYELKSGHFWPNWNAFPVLYFWQWMWTSISSFVINFLNLSFPLTFEFIIRIYSYHGNNHVIHDGQTMFRCWDYLRRDLIQKFWIWFWVRRYMVRNQDIYMSIEFDIYWYL